MAWWEGAVRLELQPESDDQPAIVPTQLIFHSIAAPWDERRLLEHWKTTNLESHFGVDYDGSVGQYIGTQTRADANAGANLRPDGTGAVSAETASRVDSSDPWTDAQLETLTALGVWMHTRHGVPLRICRTAADPGYGYHSLFPAWSTNGTDCPGAARIRQFREVLFPRIVARATGQTPPSQENGMQLTDPVTLGEWIKKAWPDDAGLADGKISVNTALGSGYGHARRASENTTVLVAQVAALAAAVQALARDGGLPLAQVQAAAQAGAEAALDKLAARLAS
jgi:hypothetical protein